MSRKRIKYIVIGLASAIIISGFLVYDKVLNAKHREIFEEPTEFTLSADELQFYFADNQETATKKYMNRVIETHGSVTEIGTNTLVLEDRVQVYFLNDLKQNTTVGDDVNIKGRCVGFDELLLLVKIDQATTIKTK